VHQPLNHSTTQAPSEPDKLNIETRPQPNVNDEASTATAPEIDTIDTIVIPKQQVTCVLSCLVLSYCHDTNTCVCAGLATTDQTFSLA
jgi:hypothetical protein